MTHNMRYKYVIQICDTNMGPRNINNGDEAVKPKSKKIQICAKRKNIGRFQTLGVCKLMLLYIFPRCLCTHFAWPNIKLYSLCTHVQLPGARLASDVSSNHSKVSRYLLCSDWSIRCLEMMKENCDVLTLSPR